MSNINVGGPTPGAQLIPNANAAGGYSLGGQYQSVNLKAQQSIPHVDTAHITIDQDGNRTLNIQTTHGYIVIHKDGRITIPDGLPLSDAAVAFWSAVKLSI